MNKLLAPLLLLAAIFPQACLAEGYSLGVGYPLASLKYDFETMSLEGRVTSGSGVQVYAGRTYWNFHKARKMKGFAGLELGYINFNVLGSKGTGSEFSAFIGGELFVADNISLMADFAPALVSLQSGGVTYNSLEFLVNFGVYLHLGGAGQKKPSRRGIQRKKAKSATWGKDKGEASFFY